jgi:3-oxoadipate enol-lactonase
MHYQPQVFEYEGCPLHYSLLGPQGTFLVVLTHGGMVDHRIWDFQVQALVSGYRLLLWDVRGHGQSRPGGDKRTIRQTARDLAGLLDHIGYTQAVLVGLSAGGWLVQEFAYRFPERVLAMAVVGQTSWLQPPLRLRLMMSPWSLWMWLAVSLLFPWKIFLRLLIKQGAGHASPRTRVYLWQVFSSWSKSEFIQHSWKGLGGLRHDPDHRFHLPLLITNGEHELAFVRHDAAAWAKREPDSRYKVIPSAGHVVNMDNPEAFNDVLLEFLTEIV